MYAVFMLFLIPIGGGIPAGVLLAKKQDLAWPITMGLYFISDLLLALAFEPILRLLARAGRRFDFLGRFIQSYRSMMNRTTAHFGSSAGPLALIGIAFGVDPMTGRAAAAAAGHGFVSGWALAITGDMFYFAVIMIATLRLNSVLRDPNITMAIILVAMFALPPLIRWVKTLFGTKRPISL